MGGTRRMNNPSTKQAQTRQIERDWLDQALHAAAPDDLTDEGFCQRVMRALPEQGEPPLIGIRSTEQQRLGRYSLIGGVLGLSIALLVGNWDGAVTVGATIDLASGLGNAWLPIQPATYSALGIVFLCTVLLWASLDES